MKKEIIFKSTITCPNCGHQKEETMPTDACQYFYECENCKSRLKPKKGHCCVFCSFATKATPHPAKRKKPITPLSQIHQACGCFTRERVVQNAMIAKEV